MVARSARPRPDCLLSLPPPPSNHPPSSRHVAPSARPTTTIPPSSAPISSLVAYLNACRPPLSVVPTQRSRYASFPYVFIIPSLSHSFDRRGPGGFSVRQLLCLAIPQD